MRLTLSRFAAALLCLALLFKALVPLGYMPDTEALARGSLRIMICSAYGASPMVMETGGLHAMPMHHGMKHNDKTHNTMPQQNDDGFCAFGSIAPLLLSLVVLLLAGSILYRPVTAIFRPLYQSNKIIVNRAARSRAPPALLTA